jgi:hypothetical protein
MFESILNLHIYTFITSSYNLNMVVSNSKCKSNNAAKGRKYSKLKTFQGKYKRCIRFSSLESQL